MKSAVAILKINLKAIQFPAFDSINWPTENFHLLFTNLAGQQQKPQQTCSKTGGVTRIEN